MHYSLQPCPLSPTKLRRRVIPKPNLLGTSGRQPYPERKISNLLCTPVLPAIIPLASKWHADLSYVYGARLSMQATVPPPPSPKYPIILNHNLLRPLARRPGLRCLLVHRPLLRPPLVFRLLALHQCCPLLSQDPKPCQHQKS